MATYFRVPDDIAVRVMPDVMHKVVVALLEHVDMTTDSATRCADALVYADVRGIDTHGVSNMMPAYLRWIDEGVIKPRANWSVVHENISTATIDSDSGLGLVVGSHAMELAIKKAKASGIGFVTMKNGGHFGAMAYHAARALEHNMIGMAMTMGGVGAPPTNGAKAMLGSNPLAVAAPTKSEVPFVFDATMSTLPFNKIGLAKRLGAKLPAGMIADAEGVPIMEDSDVPEKLMILPLGSTPELGSHKGFGLLAVIEILSGVLAGQGARFMNPNVNQFGHQVMAIDIASFTEPEIFLNHMDSFMKGLRETPPVEGADRVVYPGMIEHEVEQDRQKHGIPYHPEVIGWFKETCEDFGLGGMSLPAK